MITQRHETALLLQLICNITSEFMAGIEELSPAAGPVETRPPEDEIDEDEDEDVRYTRYHELDNQPN